MNLKRLGIFVAVIAAFGAGARAGVKYAQDHYVSKDRKFIEGQVVDKKK